MRISFKSFISNKQLLLLGIITVLLFAFSETTHTFDPIFYAYKDITIQYMGIISASGFILSFFGSILAAHYLSRKLSDKNILLISTILHALLLLVATFFIGLYVALAIILGSFFWGMRLPIIIDMFNKNTDSRKRATILSIGSLASLIGFALYAPLFGIIIDNHNINFAMRISAIFALLCVILIIFLKKE
jgi:MFS family permease